MLIKNSIRRSSRIPPGEITEEESLELNEWFFFFQAEDGIRDLTVTGVQTCALPISFGSSGFGPQANIDAVRVRESGASIRKVSTFGLNPDGFRVLSDLRLEGAGGDVGYGRGALDLTVSQPLGRAFHRDFSAAVTAGAGTSVGSVPIQRIWYLDGTNSVRGQPPGAMAGTSYWLTRTEIGYGEA